MPTQIQIKRGTATTPTGLTTGELAHNTNTNQVWIGGTGGAAWIGGVVTAGVDMGAGSALSATQIPTQSGVYNYVRNNFVSSFNGVTGAVGGVCAAQANTFTALQSFNSGVSAAGITLDRDIRLWKYSYGSVLAYELTTIGNGSLGSGLPDASNIAFGVCAGWNLSAESEFGTGTNNTYLGWGSGRSAVSTVSNTGVGYNTLANSTGSSNTSVGASSLTANTTASNNVAIGSFSMNSTTTGSDNTAVGQYALGNGNTSGAQNVAVGKDALLVNKSSSLVAIGHSSLKANTTGTVNTAVGTSSLTALTTGSNNTAVGNSSLAGITTASDNAAIGRATLQFLATTASNRNTAVGSQAGTYYGSSLPLTSATGGIYIGYDARASAVAQTNEIVIGTEARGLGSNTAVIGATTQTAATIYGLVSATNGVSAGGVSTFNAGVTFASTTDHTGVARFAAGITVSGRLDAASILDVAGGATFESTVDVAGVARFAGGVTFSSTTNHAGQARFAAGITTNNLFVSGGSTFAAAINAPGIVSSWSVITADQTAEINKGYITNKGTVLTLTLPTTAAVGSMIRVSGMNAGGWKVAQNASQIIHFGKTDTTTGTGGSLASTLTRDGVELVCCVANNEWNVVSSVGNITIV